MKIISVRFANLNSLPGPFLIRFDETPLADTGLFAITGPTGAGKSTLLDAISVGLYGRVPRHDRQVGEMVSRHAKDAFSEVEFEVHETNPDTGVVDRVRYRSRWEVKRKVRGEDKGSLNADAMSLVMSPSNVAVISGKEAVPKRVGELSGLDFGQFEQSVLLSQGKFARFLHAPEKERSALLEKMTNVGIYSRLSVAAFEKAKEEELKTKLLRAKLDATRLLSEEERGELETQLDVLHQHAEQHYEEQQELTIGLTWRTILDQLDKQLRDTGRELETLARADEMLRPDFARLDGHTRAAALAKPLALVAAAQQELDRDTTRLRDLEQSLPLLAEATAAAVAAHGVATAAHATALVEENRLRPVLSKAQQQDAEIAAAQHQLGLKRKAQSQIQHASEDAEKALRQQTAEIDKLQSQDAILKRWLIDHSAEIDLKNQVLALDREIIDLQGAQKEIATREARRTELRKNQSEVAADLLRQRGFETDALARQQAIKDEGQPCRTERDALLNGTTAAALAQHADDLTTYQQGLQQLLPKAEAVQEQQARAAALTVQIDQEAPALAAAETAVTHLETRRADGQQLLESYRRELRAQQALADLNAHRQHLQPGQPCPLCGALEHAFGADFAAEADEQEQRVTRQEQVLTTLDDELRRATAACTRHQTEQRQRLQVRQDATAAAETAYQQAAELAATLVPAPSHPADPALLRTLLAEATAQQAAAAANRRRLAVLDEKLTELRENYSQAGEAAAAAQRELPRLLERQATMDQELARLEEELAEWNEQATIFQQTVQDFLRPHRLTLPAQPPYDGLLATLRERADNYEAQVNTLTELGKTLLEKTSEHKARAEELERNKVQLAAAAAALEAEQQALEQQQAARHAYYPGPDPSGEAEQLRLATQKLADESTRAQNQLARQQQELAIKQNAHASLQAQQAQHATAHSIRQAELIAALADAGIATATEAQALLLPPAEAERLQQRRQDHLTAKAAAARRLTDLTAELNYHAESGLTPLSSEELTAQLRVLAAAGEILQQQLGAVGNQLKQDDDARQLQADGLRELQQRQLEEQRWQDLSEQIGSARGDKFSQFAQGLTLTHLARLANLRLRQLTGRYTILKTPHRNLELQIVDHDQADTVRPMASLSGGESFLVSLALALGLSELAGHKARIESLFIDEGFGTLDPEALNTALDALERLQHSGKMIGIISHVADLKDRIGTQIRVRPGAGGNSTVHLVGVMGDETNCAVE
ncbi:AAA family ATPase [Hymenobacter sp. BT683]|uniref:AAA family ATPase n=1 Tax=Hymenobacter jeongseonensis TaxID=2791027 RepID=A0ABS0IIG9_9BACT|nr:AAA family ATPase [Hymenobacter jeongseonensis]MBF9237859.1 AAA family ATPase [Hymenobacter jeongseonensis]